MRNISLVIVVILFMYSCGTTSNLSGNGNRTTNDDVYSYNGSGTHDYTADASYGYTDKNPIEVGGVLDGPIKERDFLNSLLGPNGEQVTYERSGSCCPFKTQSSPFGVGMLDRYAVSYEGNKAPVILYINMYKKSKLSAPIGFRIKSNASIK